MSVEPNKSIEAQLEAYAESRRLEAPGVFELDAPARRRFQEEVRRVYRAKASPIPAQLSWWFWTRAVLAGAAAVLALYASVLWWPRDEALILSQRTERPAESAVPDAPDRSRKVPRPESPRPAPAAERRPRTVAETAQSGRSVAPMVATGTEAVAVERSEFDGTPEMQVTRPMVFSEHGAAEAAQLVQTFQQVRRYRSNLNSPPTPQVLQVFRWFREGDTVRVIDADGSVYTGEMAATATAGAGPAERRRIVAPARLSAEAEPQEQVGLDRPSEAATSGERFAVSGTNRTMNVRVVFEGVLQSQAGGESVTTSAGRAGRTVNAATQIQGQAVVGSSTRLEILAVPRGE